MGQGLEHDLDDLALRRRDDRPGWREIVNVLADAVVESLRSGRRDLVLDPQLQRVAVQLAGELEDDSVTAPREFRRAGLSMLAHFRWARYRALIGTSSGLSERREAIRLWQALENSGERELTEDIPQAVTLIISEPDPRKRRLSTVHQEARDFLAAGQSDHNDLTLTREGIELLRPVVASAPAGTTELTAARHTLGAAWWSWFRTTGDSAALDEAISAFRQSVMETPETAPERPERYRQLFSVLHARLTRDPSAGVRVEAIDALRSAIAALPDGDELRGPWLVALARELLDQSDSDGSVEPAREAFAVLHEVGSASHRHPIDPATCLPVLARAYERLAELTGDPEAARAAASVRAAAAQIWPFGS